MFHAKHSTHAWLERWPDDALVPDTAGVLPGQHLVSSAPIFIDAVIGGFDWLERHFKDNSRDTSVIATAIFATTPNLMRLVTASNRYDAAEYLLDLAKAHLSADKVAELQRTEIKLSAAVQGAADKTIRLWLDEAATVDDDALVSAVEAHKDPRLLEAMLAKGARPNAECWAYAARFPSGLRCLLENAHKYGYEPEKTVVNSDNASLLLHHYCSADVTGCESLRLLREYLAKAGRLETALDAPYNKGLVPAIIAARCGDDRFATLYPTDTADADTHKLVLAAVEGRALKLLHKLLFQPGTTPSGPVSPPSGPKAARQLPIHTLAMWTDGDCTAWCASSGVSVAELVDRLNAPRDPLTGVDPVNAVETQGLTPLCRALRSSQLLDALLAAGADGRVAFAAAVVLSPLATAASGGTTANALASVRLTSLTSSESWYAAFPSQS
jgi:hypothetical protein